MAELSWKNAPMFAFEENFDENWIDWSLEKWPYTFALAAMYVAILHPSRHYMEQRSAYKLRVPLVIWNLILGVFSIFGTVRSLPVLINAIRYEGFDTTICSKLYFPKDYVGIWGFLFMLSKVPELGDTAFIVLRKQKLIFLHWFHHATTLVFTWRMYSTRSSVAFWFCVMNYFVHSLMYTYYAVRAAGFKINRKIAMVITFLQLSQMFMGIFAICFAIYYKLTDRTCGTAKRDLAFGVVIYTSYMILFAHFFYNSYMKSHPRKTGDKTVADDKLNGTAKRSEVNGNSAHVIHSETSDVANGVRRR